MEDDAPWFVEFYAPWVMLISYISADTAKISLLSGQPLPLT
jgi:hypothetical protein